VRLVASSSSLSDSEPNSSRLLKFSCLRSSTRCARDLWAAFASASAFAFAAAAFLAFSRSTSESSAASQESRTCGAVSESRVRGTVPFTSPPASSSSPNLPGRRAASGGEDGGVLESEPSSSEENHVRNGVLQSRGRHE
jgi:hypothetical protein